MNSSEFLDIPLSASDSRLLSLSPVLASDSSLPEINDLSLSELSLNHYAGPSSLPAQDDFDSSTSEHDDDCDADDAEKTKRNETKLREEKLQSDLFILKKLNASFAMFHEALDAAGSANQLVAIQLEQTDALLNRYLSMLSKSEEFSRLIFDEEWEGAQADEEILEREMVEAKRREAEERSLAAQREAERRKTEERERLEREKELAERERKEQATIRRGVVRGVRGTRASMRGTRGTGMRQAEPTSVRTLQYGVNPASANPSRRCTPPTIGRGVPPRRI